MITALEWTHQAHSVSGPDDDWRDPKPPAQRNTKESGSWSFLR